MWRLFRLNFFGFVQGPTSTDACRLIQAKQKYKLNEQFNEEKPEAQKALENSSN